MLLYSVDESGIDTRSEFFIFGGITVPDHSVFELMNIINDAKKNFKPFRIPKEVEIKWNYYSTNQQIKKALKREISREQHTEIKNNIICEVAKRSRDEFGIFIYLVPYKFFVNDGWKSYQIAMNICFAKFEDYLSKKNQYGIVLIDELQGLKTKDEDGKTIDLSKQRLRGHILFYILNLYEAGTGKKQISHIPLIIPNIVSTLSGLHQINDLILGAFQYYLQYVFQDVPERGLAVQIVQKYIRNLHVNFEDSNIIAALNCGINIYPQKSNPKWSGSLKKAYDLIPKLKEKMKSDFAIC